MTFMVGSVIKPDGSQVIALLKLAMHLLPKCIAPFGFQIVSMWMQRLSSIWHAIHKLGIAVLGKAQIDIAEHLGWGCFGGNTNSFTLEPHCYAHFRDP